MVGNCQNVPNSDDCQNVPNSDDCQNVLNSDDCQNVPNSDDYQNVPNSDFCRTFRLRSPPTDEDDDWNWRSEQSEIIARSNAKNSHLVRLSYIYL